MKKCPYCEKEIERIEYDAVGSIEFVETKEQYGWVDLNDAVRRLYCSECYEVLDVDDLDLLGVHADLR